MTTESPLTFYIVFHQKLFPQNTEQFSHEEMKKWFRWVAVNEKIQKEVRTLFHNSLIIKEWEMKNYSPFYQMLNFYQNSVFFHLHENPEMIKTRYIGFGQYDMSFTADNFRNAITRIFAENDPGDKVIGCFLYEYKALFQLFDKDIWTDYFFEPYNQYFKIKHTHEEIKDIPLCLLHTFIIPTWFFHSMMGFLKWNLPKIMKMLNWDTRHLAGTLERFIALCISCGIKEGRFRGFFQLEGVSHLDEQHMEDPLRNIAGGSFGKN
jgi:hypothetical protein